MSGNSRRGRRKDAEKHAAILTAAQRLFFANGVEGVAIEQIAAEAGVSKVMIYNNFKDKEGLFEAVVSEMSAGMEAIVAQLSLSEQPIEDALNDVGQQIIEKLSTDEMLAFDGLMAIEAQKHTAIAKRFYKAGPGRMHSILAANLSIRAANGDLLIDDAQMAAEDLMSLWQGMWPMERRFLQRGTPSRPQIRAKVARGTHCFLEIYGAN